MKSLKQTHASLSPRVFSFPSGHRRHKNRRTHAPVSKRTTTTCLHIWSHIIITRKIYTPDRCADVLISAEKPDGCNSKLSVGALTECCFPFLHKLPDPGWKPTPPPRVWCVSPSPDREHNYKKLPTITSHEERQHKQPALILYRDQNGSKVFSNTAAVDKTPHTSLYEH